MDKKYTTKKEALVLVYTLPKFRQYLLSKFTFYTQHETLNYCLNKLVTQRRICKWLLLFQELYLNLMIKARKNNQDPIYLSRIKTEEPDHYEDLTGTNLFRVTMVSLEDVATLLC